MKTFKLTFLFVLSALIFSGINSYASPDGKKKKGKKNVIAVKLVDFEKQAAELDGKTIVVTGKVESINGKKGKVLLLSDGQDSFKLKVAAGKKQNSFDKNLVGKTVEVTGILKKTVIDNNYIKEVEAKKGKERAEKLRKRLEKSGKEKLINYVLKSSKVQVVN